MIDDQQGPGTAKVGPFDEPTSSRVKNMAVHTRPFAPFLLSYLSSFVVLWDLGKQCPAGGDTGR